MRSPQSIPSEFDNQFNKGLSIRFYEEIIPFVEVTPLKQETQVPVLLAPGWGETPRTFKDTIRALFNRGYRVLTLEHPRQDLKLFTKNNLPHLELQKAEAILQVLDYKKIEKVDVLAHSEGAINSIIAASLKPHLVKSIVLVSPGGLVESESFTELTARFLVHFFQGLVRAFREPSSRHQLIRSTKETLKYFVKNPLMGLLEGSAISHTELQGLLVELQKKGVRITVLHTTGDWVFPIKKMHTFIKTANIEFYAIKGDHHEIYTNPERFMKYIENDFPRSTDTVIDISKLTH